MCVFIGKHPAPTGGISLARTWVSCQESATVAGSGVDLRTGYSPSQPVRSGKDALPCQAIKAISTGLGTNPGGMFIHWNCNIRDIMRSHISRWIVETVKEAYTRAERVYDQVTAHEVRALSASWAYNCQFARFGGRQESSRIPIYETWLISLMGCLRWVQWWSHNKS